MSQKKKAKQAEEAAQAKVQLLKVDEQKEQVAQVQLETKAYEDWKAKYEEETAAEIQLLNKQKQQYVEKAALKKAEAQTWKLKTEQLKNDFKKREAGELHSKQEAVKTKEKSVKIQKKLKGAESALEDEKVQSKIIKLVASAKANDPGPPDSSAKGVAEDAMKKVKNDIKNVETNIAPNLNTATKEAVRAALDIEKAEKVSIKNGKHGANGAGAGGKGANEGKKCGPGVLCAEYNKVVAAAGGAIKYMNIEGNIKLDLRKQNRTMTTADVDLKAYDTVGRQFGITGPKTPCTKGPKVEFGTWIPCKRYDNVVKEAGGAAKFEQLYMEEQAKAMKAAKLYATGATPTKEIVKVAFDKVADNMGFGPGVEEIKKTVKPVEEQLFQTA